MVRTPAPKGKPKAPRSPKRPHWQARLAKSITTTRGPEATLASLSDARRFILANFRGVTKDAGLAHAVELLFKAANSGRVSDRQAATAQMELLLRRRHWL